LYIYYHGPIEFVSRKRATALVINLSELSNYNVKTIEELETVLIGKTDIEQGHYFDAFQKIFIVETNQLTQKATITEVKIDVDIE
jgi:hypothetical protein